MMDSGTKKRLVLGLISNLISKLASSIIQLVQIPFFLLFWPKALFGEWVIVTAIPNYLGFSNIGFGNAAGNEMTMCEARGDRAGSLRAFQSCWWLIVGVMLVIGAAAASLIWLVPVGRLLNVHLISEIDTRWIVVYLGFSVLLGQLEQLLQSAYRCVGRYPYGSFIKSCMTLAQFAAMLIPVGLGKGPRTTALVYAAANVLGTLILGILVKRDIPWMEFGWKHAHWAEIKRLAPAAFAFIGFPIGNAMNLGGTLQVVGYAVGPTYVVDFMTARTVSRIALQMVQMINGSFEPEFSRSFALKDIGLIRSLHRRSCQIALIIAVVVILAMLVGGPVFLNHWTHGEVPPSRELLSILLLGVMVFSLWSTSSTIMYATNQHQKLAVVYLFATGVTLGITFFAAKWFGLIGVAASLVVSEMVMTTYVLPTSLRIADDTLPAFLASFADYPAQLRPKTLWRRFRKTEQALEG